jgi:hypothetical protein
MISSQQFLIMVSDYFAYLVADFGLESSEKEVRENIFYDQRFKDNRKVVSISYENIEDYLQVIVYLLENGELPAYDDEYRTLHLDQLRGVIFPSLDKREIERNNEEFVRFEAQSKLEKSLLKAAKELRLCLKHFPTFVFEPRTESERETTS